MADPLELKEPKTRPESKLGVAQEPKRTPSWAAVVNGRLPPKPILQQSGAHQGPSEHALPPRPLPQQPATHQGPSPHPLRPPPPPPQPSIHQGPARHPLPLKPPPQQPHSNQPSAQQPPFGQSPAQPPTGKSIAQQPPQQTPPTAKLIPEQKKRQSILSRQPSSEQLPPLPLAFQEPPDQPLQRPTVYLLRFELAYPGFGIDNTMVTTSVFATEIDALNSAITKTQALIEEHTEGHAVDEDNPSMWVHSRNLLRHRMVLRVEIIAIKHSGQWTVGYD